MKNKLFSVASGRILSTALQGITMLMLAKSFGVVEFGAFASVVAVGAVTGVMTNLGTSSLALRVRSLAEPLRAAATISLIRLPSAIVSAGICLVFGTWLLDDIPSYILVAAVSFTVSESVSEGAESLLFGLGKVGRAQGSLLVRRASLLSTVAVCIVAGIPVEVGLLVVSLLIAALTPTWLIGLLQKPIAALSIIRQARPFWYSTSLGRLEAFDIAIASLVSSPTAAGLYAAASRLTSPLNVLSSTALSLYTPAMSAAGDQPQREALFNESRRVLLIAAAALILFSPFIAIVVRWVLGEDYQGIEPVVIIITVSCAVSTMLQGYVSFCYAAGWVSTVVRIRLALVPPFLVVAAVLGSQLEALGVALGLLGLQIAQLLALKYRMNLKGR